MSQEMEFEMSAAIGVVVTSIEEPVPAVRQLRLQRVDGERFSAWTPGSHVELQLPNGLLRQYSICGASHQDDVLELAVLRESPSRGGSAYLHEHLRPGDQLQITGIRNLFGFEAEGTAAVLIAGGIGITPLLPMIAAFNDRGVPWQLHYAGRSRDRMAFLTELQQQYGEQVRAYVSEDGSRLDLSAVAAELSHDTAVYACGPERLLSEVEQILGPVAGQRLRVERFRPREHSADVIDEAFTVALAQSDLELEVPPGCSILEVLREAGQEVPSSCEEGTCGTCETEVVEGIPDHRDSVLSEMERELGETMMICVSRSCSRRLVLDL